MDISHHAVTRESVYAALGVPELWRFDGHRFEAWILGPDSSYRQQDRSKAFAWLLIADLHRFLEMRRQSSETAVMRAFQEWLRSRPA